MIVNLRQRGKSNHSLHTCEKFLLEVFSYPKMCVGLVSFFPAWLFDRSPIWHSTNGIFMEITCQNIWIGKQYFTATGIRSLKTLIHTLGYSNWILFNMKHYWKILTFIPHFWVEICVSNFSFFNCLRCLEAAQLATCWGLNRLRLNLFSTKKLCIIFILK